MPVKCELRENGHVVYITVTDPWTAHELQAIYSVERPFFDQAHHRVHTLANLTAAHRVPSGLLGARNGSPHVFHPNKGEIVVVGANSLIQMLLNTVIRVVRFEGLKLFATEEEAWAYLRELIASETAEKALA
jgi:hypothetical protein